VGEPALHGDDTGNGRDRALEDGAVALMADRTFEGDYARVDPAGHGIVGLYANPPEGALVLCVDEKSQIQAVDRTAPVPPLRPGTPERRTHDYLRHGSTNLYAALDVASGKVITDLTVQHRAIEFRKFLNLINRNVPADLDVHVIVDNSSTHKTPEIHRWLVRHPRFTL
jgi:hypothetical protein